VVERVEQKQGKNKESSRRKNESSKQLVMSIADEEDTGNKPET